MKWSATVPSHSLHANSGGERSCVSYCELQCHRLQVGRVILLNIWFGFTQAPVTSPHQSHESHPVILGRAADRSWYTLQRRGGYPRLLRVMMLGEGINDDDIKGRPAFCAALSPPQPHPHPQALTLLFARAVGLVSACWFEMILTLISQGILLKL